MFRSFIYLDEDKLYTYKRQINGENSAQPKAITKKRSTGFSAGVSAFGLNGSSETSINAEFEKDIGFDYDHFELDLGRLQGEDYFDAVLNDVDLTTVPPMKIIRLCDRFAIPEAFDMVSMVEQFKPMLMGQIAVQSEGEQIALNNILGTASADIPIIIENDDITISGKLSTKYLREGYSTLEDYAEQDVYMLCKVVGILRSDMVEVFDPLKDFIRLPRTVRRSMEANGRNIGLDKIRIAGPVLKVEVIAIYK